MTDKHVAAVDAAHVQAPLEAAGPRLGHFLLLLYSHVVQTPANCAFVFHFFLCAAWMFGTSTNLRGDARARAEPDAAGAHSSHAEIHAFLCSTRLQTRMKRFEQNQCLIEHDCSCSLFSPAASLTGLKQELK